MKLIFVLTLSLFGFSAVASTWNCEAIDPIRPANWPKDRVVVDFGSTINSIRLIMQVPNEKDGTFSEEAQELFSVSHKIRGGFKVAYCESDVVHVSEEYGMVNISSSCSLEKTQDNLRFIADFRKDQNGYLQVQFRDSNGNFVSRMVSFSACK